MAISQALHYFPGPACGNADARLHKAALDEPMNSKAISRTHGTGDVLIMHFPQKTFIDELLCPAGSVRCWGKNDGHYYGCEQELWSHSWIHGSGKVLDQLALQRTQPFVPSRPHSIRRWFEMIIHSASDDRDDGLTSIAIQGLVYALTQHEANSLPPLWAQLRIWIEKHFRKDLQLSQLAEYVGLRSSQFCEQFRQHFSCTSLHYIQQLRLHEARYLLRDQNRRIADIAHEVGYQDPAYFSRLMKKEFGASPAQLRTAADTTHS